MDCLNNLIGIRGGCDTPETPSSGLYLNDLTGISINAAEAAIGEETQSGFQLLRDKLAFSIAEVAQTLRMHLAEKVKLGSLLESDIIGHPKEDLRTVAAEGYYKGLQLRIDDYSHAELHINSIRLQAQTSGDIPVKVFDLISGKEIDSYTVTTVAGETTELVVNKKYKNFSRRINLFFAYDATSIGSYETTLYSGSPGCCGANQGLYKCGGRLSDIYTRAAKIGLLTTKTNQNLSSITYSPGLSITYSLICSTEPLMCQLSQALALPILYKTGANIMLELISSPRLNSIVTLQKESHQELLTMYETKYEEAMRTILQHITIPNDICYSCKPAVSVRTHIP